MIDQLLDQLFDKSKRLCSVDDEILNFLLVNGFLGKDNTKEFDVRNEYSEKLLSIKKHVKQHFVKLTEGIFHKRL